MMLGLGETHSSLVLKKSQVGDGDGVGVGMGFGVLMGTVGAAAGSPCWAALAAGVVSVATAATRERVPRIAASRRRPRRALGALVRAMLECRVYGSSLRIPPPVGYRIMVRSLRSPSSSSSVPGSQ